MINIDDIIAHEMSKSYSSSKFMFSATGFLKILSVIAYFTGAILFLSLDTCPGTASWYALLFPVTMIIAGVIVAILYGVFASGLAKKAFTSWNMADMVVTAITLLISIGICIVTLVTCSSSSEITYYIAPPIGIVAAICLAISTTIIFMKWRTKKDEYEEYERQMRERAKRPTLNPATFRKSVIV